MTIKIKGKRYRIFENGLSFVIKEMWLFVIVGAIALIMALNSPKAVATAPVNAETVAAEPQPTKLVYLGEFTATGYCPCEICCGEWSNPDNPITASGTIANAGRTIGADWGTLPEGTVIIVEGLGERVVEDKPADWVCEKYDGKIIDVYFDTHEEAVEYGKRTVDVWIEEARNERNKNY